MTPLQMYERVKQIIDVMPADRGHDKAFDLLMGLHVDLVKGMAGEYEAELFILELAGQVPPETERN